VSSLRRPSQTPSATAARAQSAERAAPGLMLGVVAGRATLLVAPPFYLRFSICRVRLLGRGACLVAALPPCLSLPRTNKRRRAPPLRGRLSACPAVSCLTCPLFHPALPAPPALLSCVSCVVQLL
jgi:hypothetical protein